MQVRNILTLAALVSTGFASQRISAAGGLFRRQTAVCEQYSLDTCTDGTCYNEAAGDICCTVGGMCPVGYSCGTGPNVGYCCPSDLTEAECAAADVTGTAAPSDPESTTMDFDTTMTTTTRRSSATATTTRDSDASATTRSASSARASETSTNGAPRMVTDGAALAAMAAIAGAIML